jgi:hypothetical protein
VRVGFLDAVVEHADEDVRVVGELDHKLLLLLDGKKTSLRVGEEIRGEGG